MASEVLMPALSPTMTEGKIARWVKNVGEPVHAGDVLAEIETDKATMEVEAVDEGVLAKIVIPEGTDHVPINTPIAVIAENGEDVGDVEAKPRAVPAQAKAPEPPDQTEEPTPPRPAVHDGAAVATARPAPAPGPEAGEYTGKTVTQTVREALRDAIAEEMRRDNTVFLIGEEVAEYQGAYKVSQGLLQEFGPRRVIDTPITEQGFTGLGIGAAFGGLRPIVEFMTFNFAMQAMDQLINSAAKTRYMSGGQMSAPIVFRGPNGIAARVAAQHSQCYASWYAHVPGLKVVAPYTGADHKGLLKSAIRDPNPVIFLEHELVYGESFAVPDDPEFLVPIGKARIARQGEHVTITAFSRMVKLALQAAEELEKTGISTEVIDLRSLRPFDVAAVAESVKKTNRLVSVEEGWPFAGIGSEIAAIVMEECFDWLDAPVKRVAGKDVPLPYAANLERLAVPQVEDIVAAAREVTYR
ncbi:MAG: pyruvate dehydrogenase complex E1 component subunit beta [Alphaproteobacteria bacterium]|nr:pyruvate dehydrogenase complex E1 component subunit beta [Alphaproteobacteria bacterium]MBV9154575.1 pyruvate dehydrogenase complex E1 component subunit beta [Alphaproteobacteria bacterium]